MEELKLVIDAVAGLGEQAKEAFIWWLVFDKLLPSIVAISTFSTLGYVLTKWIAASTKAKSEDDFLKWARDELKTGVAGPLTDSEIHRTISALRRLVEERRK